MFCVDFVWEILIIEVYKDLLGVWGYGFMVLVWGKVRGEEFFMWGVKNKEGVYYVWIFIVILIGI